MEGENREAPTWLGLSETEMARLGETWPSQASHAKDLGNPIRFAHGEKNTQRRHEECPQTFAHLEALPRSVLTQDLVDPMDRACHGAAVGRAHPGLRQLVLGPFQPNDGVTNHFVSNERR